MGNIMHYPDDYNEELGEGELEAVQSPIERRKEKDYPNEEIKEYGADDVQINTGIEYQQEGMSDENAGDHTQRKDEVELFDQEYRPVHDIYAMLTVFPVSDKAFIYALFIFLAQICILVLFIADQMSEVTRENIFHLPVFTTGVVFFGQIFALYVTIMTASDVTQSLDVFFVIYDEKIEEHFSSASKNRWILANIIRGIEGFISIMVALLFIVQSTDNLGLFQNFAAVAFVSELDNIAFYVADNGHTIVSLISRTSQIKEHLVFKHQPRKREIKTLQKRAMRALTVAVFGFYIYTAFKRLTGSIYELKCQSFVVLFDDVDYDFFQSCETCPDAWKSRNGKIVFPNFNGIYEVNRTSSGRIDTLTNNGYPAYIQTGEAIKTLRFDEENPLEPRGHFEYCWSENAWVFIIKGVKKVSTNADVGRDESCPWLMRSPETKEFDFNLVPKEGWVMWTGLVKPSENFKIICAECEKPYASEDVLAENFTATGEYANSFCNYHGICAKQEKECVCEKASGWIGVQCQICAKCESYAVTSPDLVNFTEYYFRIDDDFDLPVEVHSRPAFYRGLGADSNFPNPEMMILLHTGERYAFWNITDQLTPDTLIGTRNQILIIISNFHSQWSLNAEMVPFRSQATKSDDPFNLTWSSDTKKKCSFNFQCTKSGYAC